MFRFTINLAGQEDLLRYAPVQFTDLVESALMEHHKVQRVCQEQKEA